VKVELECMDEEAKLLSQAVLSWDLGAIALKSSVES
jgi:hypothetical protein